jgi:hypothetical protein
MSCLISLTLSEHPPISGIDIPDLAYPSDERIDITAEEPGSRVRMGTLVSAALTHKPSRPEFKFAPDSAVEGSGFELVWGFSRRQEGHAVPLLCLWHADHQGSDQEGGGSENPDRGLPSAACSG